MRIGIMSASVRGQDLHENQRLAEEIKDCGAEPVIINYRRTAVGITEAGRFLYDFDAEGNLSAVEVDAVIPRIGKYVVSGVLALGALESNGVFSTS